MCFLIVRIEGAHHLIYGVEVHHYQSFGVALVDTLEAILGKDVVSCEEASMHSSRIFI
jgi:uncharacterized Fe-S cluster-containing protein